MNQISMNRMGLDEILNELKGLNELMQQESFITKLERDRTQTLLQCVTTPPEFLATESIDTNARTRNVSTPVMLDQERFLMEQQSYQTQLLLFSMHNLINTYNDNRTQPYLLNPNFPVVPPPPNAYSAEVPQPKLGNSTPPGVTTPSARFLVPQSTITDATTITTTQKTSNVLSGPPSINAENGNFSTFDDDLETFGDIFIGPDSPWEGVDFLDHPTPNHLKDNASRSSLECKNQQVISELPSTAAKVLSEKDMNVQDPDSLTAMKSFKNRTTNLSSKRNRQHNFGKENC